MSEPTDSAARWRKIVRGHAESGLSVAAYCRRARVPESSFYAWRRKLRDATTFAEVHITPQSGSGRVNGTAFNASALEVRLRGGPGIVVQPGIDQATLLALVDALERGSGAAATREASV